MGFRSLTISVNSSDSSYVPHKVAIEGGDSVDHMSVLANVRRSHCRGQLVQLFILHPGDSRSQHYWRC